MASDMLFLSQYDSLKRAVTIGETGERDVDSVFEQIQPQLQDSDLRREFFKLLTSPTWLDPLNQAGFFSHPQGPESVEGGIRHPYWPASQYLVHMAGIAPKKVAEILMQIKTGNSSILSDIVDAASKMPVEIAAALVPTVCDAIQADVFDTVFSQATDLCIQLASNDQDDAAMMLAEALFGLERQSSEGTNRNRDRYWYEEGMKKIVPLLTDRRPEQFINCLCKWLGKAIEQEGHYSEPSTRGESSWYWRPAIEEHEQNRDYDFPCGMVGFVRQAFEQAISNGQMTLERGLAIAEEQPFSVFQRLRIHLVNRFAEQARDLARSEMMKDRAMLEDQECKHEYAMLIGQRFSMLSKEERNVWFGWVEIGPDMEWHEEYHKKNSSNPESLAIDRANYVREWQFERLHWIRSYLDGKWKNIYQEMLTQFGEPLHADLNSYHGPVRCGFDSPFNTEDLSVLSFAQAVERVDSWRPGRTRDFRHDPQKEGLAGTFGQYVASKAQEFSGQAEILKGRQPIYVRTFIERITDVAKTENVDIDAVLQLCIWVVDQPIGQDAAVNEASWSRVDRGWQYTRDDICRFLQTICDRAAKEPETYALLDFRERISALLDSLLCGSATSYLVDETERKNPQVYDFVTAAINSPRGKAMDALIAYVRWIAKHLQREEAGRTFVPNGFGDMPEVKRMLDWQITTENACFESFAIVGTYIGLLHWIDSSWVGENIPVIFDLPVIERDPMHAHGWAAWNAFLVWGHTSPMFYRMLRSQYFYAVERLPKAIVPENAGKTPLHHLGEHLVLLYGRGNLAECSDESLLFRFLETVSNDVRSQTIAFVGHSLRTSKKLPEAIVSRFRDLWDWYWPKFGSLDAKAKPQGGQFGWWFTSKQFSDEWSLERLEQYMQVLPIPEFAERIVERLTELAGTHIEAVTRILDRMIRADKEGWRAYGWHSSAEEILRIALEGNDIVRGAAIRLIDDLGRRGYVEFGKLLDPSAEANR